MWNVYNGISVLVEDLSIFKLRLSLWPTAGDKMGKNCMIINNSILYSWLTHSGIFLKKYNAGY